jgi:hypothetical protein
LLICDHSPTALLAARGYSFKRAILGTGFFCPRPGEQLPTRRPDANERDNTASEANVLAQINTLLDDLKESRLPRLSDLYREVDETILTTFAELDHFGAREDGHYWGAWPAGVGENASIDWPKGDGLRVYGYLKPFHALETLLEQLSALRRPTMIVVDGIDADLQKRFASDTMHFLARPIEAAQAAAWCDFAVLNATHGMLSAMLLAGKPTLNVPVQLRASRPARAILPRSFRHSTSCCKTTIDWPSPPGSSPSAIKISTRRPKLKSLSNA